MEIDLGKKLSEIRKDKHMSIASLSEKSGVSTGMISQIERNLTAPSVVNLWKLSQALDVNISCFFEDNQKTTHTVIRSGKHRKLSMEWDNITYKLLSPEYHPRMLDMVEVEIKPGAVIDEIEGLTHDGEECGYVIEGTLTVFLGGEYIELNKGDSIYFPCDQPHKYLNLSDKPCFSIWAMTPLFF